MSAKRDKVLIIDGHPDARTGRFIHALGEAYAHGAREAGHEVKIVKVSELDFPLLKNGDDFTSSKSPKIIESVQTNFNWSDHIVILYPLWLGSMPALLKAFFEQVMRPGFAFKAVSDKQWPQKLLKGKSARVVVTMGMPAFFYKWYFRAHSLKSLERNILSFAGIAPIRANIIGSVEAMDAQKRAGWLQRMRSYGASAH